MHILLTIEVNIHLKRSIVTRNILSLNNRSHQEIIQSTNIQAQNYEMSINKQHYV